MISIIIPVYNVEDYLEECFNSLIQQSYKEFEIILVNDGSTDTSLEKCKQFQTKYKNYSINIINKKNEGVTAARRDGVKASYGEWIMFMDADDILEEDTLQILASYTSKEINIILGSHSLLIENNKKLVPNRSIGLFNRSEYIDLFLQSKVESAPWGKLFKKEIFTEDIFLLPREIKVKEDFIMNFRIACKQNKNALFIKEPIYIYRYLRKDSAVFKALNNKKNISYEINILNYITQALIDSNLYHSKKRLLTQLFFTHVCSWRNYILKEQENVVSDINNLLRLIKKENPHNFNYLKYYYLQLLCYISKIIK